MTLRLKTIILVCLFLFLQSIFFGINFYQIILESFVRLEKRDMVVDLNRAISFLESNIDALDLINADWAAWDDTYEFINEINTAYIKSNLVEGTFTNLGLNLMAFINPAGEVTYGNGFDLVGEEKTSLPEGFVEYIAKNPSLVKFSDSEGAKRGIIVLPRHVMMISSLPILTSMDEGPIRGALVMGRYLDTKEVHRYSRILHLNMSVVDTQGLPEITHLMVDAANDLVVRTWDNEKIIGYGLIRDVFNAPAVALKIVKERDVYGIGVAALKNIAVWMTIFGILFLVLMIMLLDKLVLVRIRNLNSGVSRIITAKDNSERLDVKGKDELAEFAHSINGMLTTIEKDTVKLKNLSNRLINFQEMERQRISDELHDQLGQDMTVLKFGIRNAMKRIPDDDTLNIRQPIEEILPLVDMIIENIRSLARDLSPAILRELGLESALNRLVENFARFGEYECSLDMEHIDGLIPADKHILLYRIFQELLTNIAKHANASRVDISARREDGHVRISVSDNGGGFDVSATLQAPVGHNPGLGLTIIEQRVDLLGGTVEIQSIENRGTTTFITIPIENRGVA
jgi:signal transduction histidine kinase